VFAGAHFEATARHRLRRIGRQRDDEIEAVGDQLVHGVGRMHRHVDADLLHHLVHEIVGLAGADAGRADDETAGEELSGQRRRDGTADRVHRTDKEHGRQVAVALVDAAGKGLDRADQREQPTGGVEVHLQLVVEPGAEELGRLVVEAAAGHVDGLDLERR
jgi:hypothetical protein